MVIGRQLAVHIFIDEGGTFIPATGWAVVCSLAIPHKEVGPASKRSAKNFLEIGDVDDLDGLSAEPEPPKLPSKKWREKEEDESQRLKRIMAICAGC